MLRDRTVLYRYPTRFVIPPALSSIFLPPPLYRHLQQSNFSKHKGSIVGLTISELRLHLLPLTLLQISLK